MLPKLSRAAFITAVGATALLAGVLLLREPDSEKPEAFDENSVSQAESESNAERLEAFVAEPVEVPSLMPPSLLGTGRIQPVPISYRLQQLPGYRALPGDDGRLPDFPVHEFNSASLESLRTASEGDLITLEVTPGFEISGRVDSVVRGLPNRSLQLGIALENGEGRMIFSETRERTRAHVFYEDKSFAHRITGFPKTGDYVIEELPLSQVLCCLDGATYPISDAETLPNRARAGLVANAEPPPAGNLVAANSDPAPGEFQSLSGSQFVIYLDFDGEVVNDPNWHPSAINAQTSGINAANRLETLRRVAEDFAPFNINVTDKRSVFDATSAQRRTMCVVTPTDTASPGSGGVAFLDSFRDNTVSWCFVVNDPNDIADTISHEVGHQLKLAHDGRGGQEYHPGHGSSPMNWGPIMGAAFNSNVSQWSNGDYSNSSNTENDFARIVTNGFSYRADDVGNSTGSATVLTAVSGDFAASAVIERNTDVDFFQFTLTEQSTLLISANPKTPGPNMKADLRLYDIAGTQLRENVGGATMNASISQLLQAGIYYVSVRGAAHLTPDTGWSTYGSVGQFDLLVDSDNNSGGGGGGDGGGGDPDPESLTSALDIVLPVSDGGSEIGWAYQTDVTSDGVDAAASATITHDETTSMQITVVDAETISFYWKVSSERRFDYLNFYVDGVRQTRISGEVDWTQRTYSLPAGTHTLTWSYVKDESVSNGSDQGWVDRVVITGSGDNFFTWIASQGVLQVGPNDDPEGDGVENLFEYVTGGSAGGFDSNGIGLTVDVTGKIISFRYRPGLTDIRLRLQGSRELQAWQDLANGSGGAPVSAISGYAVTVVSGSGSNYDSITITAPNSALWQFYRIVVNRL